MRERRLHNCFYTSSLNHRATSSLPGQPEPGFHYIQKFYKSQTKITLLNTKHTRFLTHKNLEPQPTRITLADLKSHQANHPKQQEHPNLMVVVPSTPYMCSSSYSQAKMPPRSTKIFKHELQLSIAERECFPKMNDKISFRKTQIRTSASEKIAYIVLV